MRMGRAPMRGRGGGLVGAMARTAVVAGTATAVSGRVQRRQAERAQAEAAPAEQAPAPEQQQPQAPQAPQAPEPPQQGPTAEMLANLERLAALHEQGVLTPEEFAVQKARLLGL